jgi:hypothetical protein
LPYCDSTRRMSVAGMSPQWHLPEPLYRAFDKLSVSHASTTRFGKSVGWICGSFRAKERRWFDEPGTNTIRHLAVHDERARISGHHRTGKLPPTGRPAFLTCPGISDLKLRERLAPDSVGAIRKAFHGRAAGRTHSRAGSRAGVGSSTPVKRVEPKPTLNCAVVGSSRLGPIAESW